MDVSLSSSPISIPEGPASSENVLYNLESRSKLHNIVSAPVKAKKKAKDFFKSKHESSSSIETGTMMSSSSSSSYSSYSSSSSADLTTLSASPPSDQSGSKTRKRLHNIKKKFESSSSLNQGQGLTSKTVPGSTGAFPGVRLLSSDSADILFAPSSCSSSSSYDHEGFEGDELSSACSPRASSESVVTHNGEVEGGGVGSGSLGSSSGSPHEVFQMEADANHRSRSSSTNTLRTMRSVGSAENLSSMDEPIVEEKQTSLTRISKKVFSKASKGVTAIPKIATELTSAAGETTAKLFNRSSSTPTIIEDDSGLPGSFEEAHQLSFSDSPLHSQHGSSSSSSKSKDATRRLLYQMNQMSHSLDSLKQQTYLNVVEQSKSIQILSSSLCEKEEENESILQFIVEHQKEQSEQIQNIANSLLMISQRLNENRSTLMAVEQRVTNMERRLYTQVTIFHLFFVLINWIVLGLNNVVSLVTKKKAEPQALPEKKEKNDHQE